MTRAALAVGAVALLLMSACSGSDAAAPATTTTLAGGSELPPPGALDLEELYGDALADLGLRLTARGGLIDRSGGGYEPSPTGTHLALYVEPIGERSAEEYVEGIRSVAVVFADVFERWGGLESYDVCQEPAEDAEPPAGQPYDDSEPLPVTQIELTREQAAAIDWATVTVEDLIEASRQDPPGLALRVGSTLAGDPAFRAVAGDDQGWQR